MALACLRDHDSWSFGGWVKRGTLCFLAAEGSVGSVGSVGSGCANKYDFASMSLEQKRAVASLHYFFLLVEFGVAVALEKTVRAFQCLLVAVKVKRKCGLEFPCQGQEQDKRACLACGCPL